MRCSNYWINGKQDVEHDIMNCHSLHFISWSWGWPTGDVTSENHSCMNTMTKRNFVALSMQHTSWLLRNSINESWSHNANPKKYLTCSSDYKKLTSSPHNGKNQPLVAIHSQTLPAKNTSQYNWEFYLPTINNYFLISLTWICLIWVHVNQQILSIHTGWWSPLSAI